ncbi:MAG: alpha/beta fold hydrolase [Nonlabens sp.]
MNIKRNTIIEGENGRPILIDHFHADNEKNLPIVVFCHGFKGFKDWGAWDLMGLAFAKAGYLFIKFNYSHNGGTAEQPIDFPDLEAFGNNNYSIEVRDTLRVLDWISNNTLPAKLDDLTLIGHSRAGGIATIVASQDERVSRLITMASVAHYEERFPKGKELSDWKENGVYYIKNGRTHQEMPLYYQFYEDFLENREQLDIIKSAKNLGKPHLILHCDEDPTVDIQDAKDLLRASKKSQLKIIRGGNHVFGASHPWEKFHLPEDLRQATQCILNYLDSKN